MALGDRFGVAVIPEWADATFVLVGTIAAVVAYRYGAAATEERRDAVVRAARLLTSGAMGAVSAGVGTIAADGTAPTATLLLFGVAGVALACGFTMRLGVRLSSRGSDKAAGTSSLAERYGRALLTMALTAMVSFFATSAFDSGEAPATPPTPSPDGSVSD